MGKLLKYCLSLICLAGLMLAYARMDDFYDETTDEEKIALANQKFIALKEDTSFYKNDNRYQRGLRYYKTLEEVSDLNPNHAGAWMELANAYLRKGMIKEWKIHFDKAMFLDPLKYQGTRGYILLFFFKNYEKALADFEAVDIINPKGPDYIRQTNIKYLKALCHMQMGDYNEAITHFDSYIKEETKTVGLEFINEAAFLYKGIIYSRIKDFDQALIEFNKGLKVNDKLADIYFHQSRLYFEKGQYSKAIKYVELADENFKVGNVNRMWSYNVFEKLDAYQIDDLRYRINLALIEKK